VTPDDPRHGKLAGWAAGCREDCCRNAKARYDKTGHHERSHGIRRSVDSTGFRRRVRALQAIGWSINQIAIRLGVPRGALSAKLVNGTRVYKATNERMIAVYDELSMTAGPEIRSVRAAAKHGWAPPLAWDEGAIDDPDAEPNRGSGIKRSDTLDEVVVEVALSGRRVNATKAERLETILRWRESGRPLQELERIQHWNTRRDLRGAA
jgi:hypothetical protein